MVFISQNVSPGIVIFRKDFIEYLIRQEYEVYVFAIDFSLETRAIVKSMGAIPIDYTLSKVGTNPFIDLRDTWRLSRQLKKIAPDVVFSFFVKPSIYGTISARLAGVSRCISMLEGLGYIHTPARNGFSLKKRVLQRIHGFLVSVAYAFADVVLFLNSDDPVDLTKKAFLNQSKLQVLGPIGLNLERYPYRAVDLKKPIRFIFIARLLAEKGVFEYLEAARLVKEQHPSSEFLMLGGLDPDNPGALSKQQLDEVIQEGVVIYPGHVSNVPEWIADSHVFVLPSYYREGFPRSTQEAMAIGRAVITTDVPGCKETVEDGVNGFIVPPFNAQVLAEKMLYLIEHPKEIQRMGDEGHRMAVEQFDVQKINRVLAKIVLGEEV
ncbi:glycosyltransferase family 1 protein [Aliidiomarina sanyensis]|uniref:Glycosyltransferase family 1 protein n=1 Tax=Aliidiomarina sanyensis TaxID=1249555 RepID=A0A432WBD1_9GAMM|nr:glycosyltransferase family 1 protein [Aliidiomarina sanyensis]